MFNRTNVSVITDVIVFINFYWDTFFLKMSIFEKERRALIFFKRVLRRKRSRARGEVFLIRRFACLSVLKLCFWECLRYPCNI